MCALSHTSGALKTATATHAVTVSALCWSASTSPAYAMGKKTPSGTIAPIQTAIPTANDRASCAVAMIADMSKGTFPTIMKLTHI